MRVARSHVAELAGRGCPSGHELISATAFGLASERERADARDHDRSPRRGPSWSASTRPKFERSRLSSTTSGSFSGSRPPPQRSTRPSNAPGASASPRPYVGWATACAADASVGPDTHIPNELRQGETARGGRSRSLHLASDVTGHTDPTSKLKAAAPSRHSRTSRARGGRSEHSCYCLEATATGRHTQCWSSCRAKGGAVSIRPTRAEHPRAWPRPRRRAPDLTPCGMSGFIYGVEGVPRNSYTCRSGTS